MKRRIAALLVLLGLFIGGCARQEPPLLFHAAAGQRSALDEIGAIFEERHPGTRVNFSYKGSGYFLPDLVRSREGDLYMPGEEFYFLQARDRGFINNYDPVADVPAHFVTVLITPKGNPAGIRRLEDLARPGVRVGLGNPKSCAIGVRQEKTLRRAGILEAVLANTRMSAKCIPELGNAIQHRGIDATVVWSSTAARTCAMSRSSPRAPVSRRCPVARGVLTSRGTRPGPDFSGPDPLAGRPKHLRTPCLCGGPRAGGRGGLLHRAGPDGSSDAAPGRGGAGDPGPHPGGR